MPDDADKMFVLWVPDEHGTRTRGRPCFTQGALLLRDGKLDMKVVFRSHDIPKGWVENVYGVMKLMEEVAHDTGYEVGRLVVDSESGHVYKGDLPWVEEIVREHVWDGKPVRVFRPEDIGDPRGNWNINIVDGQIVALLQHPKSGMPLVELKGRTARQISSQLIMLGLIEQPDHAMDIAMELAKAEISLQLGITYTQDKPFPFREVRSRLK
jgi:hypothetical protein